VPDKTPARKNLHPPPPHPLADMCVTGAKSGQVVGRISICMVAISQEETS